MELIRKQAVAVGGVLVLIAALYLLFGTGSRYKSMSMEEAEKMIAEGGSFLIVDVRRADEYAVGHIPGAVNVPLDSILEEDVADALPDKNRTLLIYCYAGRRSSAAAEKLKSMGYKNAWEFGGIVDWSGEVVKGDTPEGSETGQVLSPSAIAEAAAATQSAAEETAGVMETEEPAENLENAE